MNRAVLRAVIVVLALLAFAMPCPAPLIFTPGEGWRYEKVGETGSWTRGRAKDQLDVAQESFDKQDFGTATKAARRTVNVWPFSDYAPQAQYLLARCYEAKGEDERAFNAYQTLLTLYPKVQNYDEIILRQMHEIGEGRPKLVGDENGKFRVVGGLRLPTDSDLPAPKPIELFDAPKKSQP